jgi:hypothetical protein
MKIEVSVEQLKQHSLFVATPMYGAMCGGSYTKACTDLAMLCTANGIKIKFYYLFNESLIQRARNYCVDEFMRSDCSHLVFIDSDIGFNARDVLSLLAVNIADPEAYNIVTGPYPKKTIAWEKIAEAAKQGRGNENPFELEMYAADYVMNPVGEKKTFNLGEPLEVGEAGTGFMLIPRDTLERYRKAYPELLYRPDHARTENFDGTTEIMAYFDCIIDPESKRYLSEDYFFCKMARQTGMRVWLCPWMQLQHTGAYVYKGSMGHIGSLGNLSMTADSKSKAKSYKKPLTNKKKRNKINR